MADLKHQRADLQSLVDTLPDPILVADAGGTVTLMNDAAARLLDLTRTRALGQAVVRVVTDEAVLQLFDRARGGPFPTAEPPLPVGDGSGSGNGSGNGSVPKSEIENPPSAIRTPHSE